jgi:hypothetical protein
MAGTCRCRTFSAFPLLEHWSARVLAGAEIDVSAALKYQVARRQASSPWEARGKALNCAFEEPAAGLTIVWAVTQHGLYCLCAVVQMKRLSQPGL